MKKLPHFLLSIFLFWGNNAYCQGCSDAGFCSMGSFNNAKPMKGDSAKQKLSIIINNGIGDEFVYVITPGIQYDRKLNEQWALQAKLTGNYANGSLGDASGLGDIYLSASFSPKTKGKFRFTITAGGKIPLNSGNLKVDNRPLPMLYQSSLGTIDFVGGLTIAYNKLNLSVALQQPLTGENENTFLPSKSATPESLKYIASNKFDRKADGLVKLIYYFKTNINWNISSGLLAIYHFGRDTYRDPGVSSSPIELVGSEGLTLNATSYFQYQLNRKMSLGVTVGIPFVVRDIRPDGLTRAFVLSPEFSVKF